MYDHLSLPKFVRDSLDRRKKVVRGGGYQLPVNRNKVDFYSNMTNNASQITQSFNQLKEKFNGKINPRLIYRICVDQSVDYNNFVRSLNSLGGIQVLSVAENKKGYWVVFSNDTEFKVFKGKLAQYSGVIDGNKYDFFNAIETIEDISVEDKVGNNLKINPLNEGEVDYLDLELWRMDDREVSNFISSLEKSYDNWEKFRVCDRFITNSFALFRIKISKEILDEIIHFKEIAKVDRPFIPTFRLSDYNGKDVSDLTILPPDENATGVLIIDSGIISNHPLLEKAVGGEENFQSGEKETHDTVGHGTAVAGNAIYGDLNNHIRQNTFQPSNWLFSAKVMYGERLFNGEMRPVYDEEKLFEGQLYGAIRTFLDNDTYKVKVVNISFGNSNDFFQSKNNRQFPLASLLDDLAYFYKDVVFVVSAGNANPEMFIGNLENIVDQYPNYLVDNENFRIINPATSALSITVGSITPEISFLDNGRLQQEIYTAIAKSNEPSPFTRVGFGINGMLKPELVHYGGNLIYKEEYGRLLENSGGKIPVLTNIPTSKLFGFDSGTSFSAPKVTHIIGQIANKFPEKSANFIKNLLLQSAVPFKIAGISGTESHVKTSQLKMQGYGLPVLENAISSFDNQVVLLDESQLGLNKVQVYSFEIPESFFVTKGEKCISVALTYNPITRMTRGDSYLGNRMEFKLFHTISSQYVTEKYAQLDFTADEQVIEELSKYEVEFSPGTTTRNSGCHQKGIKVFKRNPQELPKAPLTLVVTNYNKWHSDESYLQDYCVSVKLTHTQPVQLYEEIRSTIQQRVRVR